MLLRLDAKYTKELADAVENDALRDDAAAGRRRLHIKAVRQSVREATASGVDNAASPWLADTAERDYFTLREADHYAKTTGRNLVWSILMSRQSCLYNMATYAIIGSNTHAPPAEYKCLK